MMCSEIICDIHNNMFLSIISLSHSLVIRFLSEKSFDETSLLSYLVMYTTPSVWNGLVGLVRHNLSNK